MKLSELKAGDGKKQKLRAADHQSVSHRNNRDLRQKARKKPGCYCRSAWMRICGNRSAPQLMHGIKPR